MDVTGSGYRTQSLDTPLEIERLVIDRYRGMTPEQKLTLVFGLQASADGFALADIRARHPGIDEREARLRLASRKYSRDLMVQAFDWDPEIRGY